MHINPIKSKPLSPEGRENYDRIFRKQEITGQTPTTEELESAWHDKQVERARDLHHELAQKHLDESA